MRNNLARMPWPVREVACRIMFDGGTNEEVDEAVRSACEREGVEPKEIHNTTILAYRKSAEYQDYCQRKRANQAERDEARMMWATTADDSTSSAVRAARYLAIKETVSLLKSGNLSSLDATRLAQTIDRIQKDLVEETKREAQAEREALEIAHEEELAAIQAELNKAKAEIQRLRACLADHKIDPDAVKSKDGGLSEETLAQIEERGKLL